MARLIYASNMSLDGRTEDARGDADLELLDEHRFNNGVVQLHYCVL